MPSAIPAVSSARESGAAAAPAPEGWLLWVALGLTVLVFAPITANFFFGDDLLALYDVANKSWLALLIEPYGGHMLTTRNLVYVALYQIFGPAPAVYFTVVLLTHLANVALLFAIIRQLTGSARLACFGAALWGAAPLNEGALGWWAVYGQVLVVTAVLWIIYRIGVVAERGRLATGELAVWGVLMFGASTSFGIGLGLSVSLPAVAWLLLPRGAVRRRAVFGLAVVAAAVVLGYTALLRLAAYLFPGFPQFGLLLGAVREFTGVLGMAWSMGVFGLKGLFFGPLAHTVARESWAVHALVGLAGLALVVAFVRAAAPRRKQMLAALILSGVCYGAIAAGRILFLPSVGARLIEAERYHYAAPMPLALLASLVLAQLAAWWQPPRRLGAAALASWLVAFVVLQLTLGRGIDHHTAQRRMAGLALEAMDELIEAQSAGSDVYIENQLFYGVGPLVVRNPESFPGWAGLFAVYHPEPVVAGRRVYFVESDPEVRRVAADGRRSAGLLVAPEAVPAERVLKLRRR